MSSEQCCYITITVKSPSTSTINLKCETTKIPNAHRIETTVVDTARRPTHQYQTRSYRKAERDQNRRPESNSRSSIHLQIDVVDVCLYLLETGRNTSLTQSFLACDFEICYVHDGPLSPKFSGLQIQLKQAFGKLYAKVCFGLSTFFHLLSAVTCRENVFTTK